MARKHTASAERLSQLVSVDRELVWKHVRAILQNAGAPNPQQITDVLIAGFGEGEWETDYGPELGGVKTVKGWRGFHTDQGQHDIDSGTDRQSDATSPWDPEP